MSPRGRPTTNPKTLNTRIRMSDEDVKMLDYCCERTGKRKSEIIRIGIKKVYEEVKKENDWYRGKSQSFSQQQPQKVFIYIKYHLLRVVSN